jgi:hypothetical protein
MKIDISLDKNLKNKKSIWKKNRAGMPMNRSFKAYKSSFICYINKKTKK